MTRYLVECSDEFIRRTDLVFPPGLRPVEEAAIGDPGWSHWWLFDDDNAPPEMEGKRVELQLSRNDDGTPGPYVALEILGNTRNDHA